MTARWLLCPMVVLVMVGEAGLARGEDAAAAKSLFDEGSRLYDAGDYAAACTKFEASLELDAENLDTRGKLAFCYEKAGRLATAWTLWRDVNARAKRANRVRAQEIATQHIADLEPRLARMTLVVPTASAVPGLEVRKDGVVVPHGGLGIAVAVDKGTRKVEASAPGYRTWSQDVAIADGEQKTVEIGPLEREPAAVTTPPGLAAGRATPATGAPAGASAVQTRDDGPAEQVGEPARHGRKARFAIGVSGGGHVTRLRGTPIAYPTATASPGQPGGRLLAHLDWRPEDVIGVRGALVTGFMSARFEACAPCVDLGDLSLKQLGLEVGPRLSFTPERAASLTLAAGIGVAKVFGDAVDESGEPLEHVDIVQLHGFAAAGLDFRILGGSLSLSARFDASVGHMGGMLDVGYDNLGVSIGYAWRL